MIEELTVEEKGMGLKLNKEKTKMIMFKKKITKGVQAEWGNTFFDGVNK